MKKKIALFGILIVLVLGVAFMLPSGASPVSADDPTPTLTKTPTLTRTPTVTLTPTITLTPTPDVCAGIYYTYPLYWSPNHPDGFTVRVEIISEYSDYYAPEVSTWAVVQNALWNAGYEGGWEVDVVEFKWWDDDVLDYQETVNIPFQTAFGVEPDVATYIHPINYMEWVYEGLNHSNWQDAWNFVHYLEIDSNFYFTIFGNGCYVSITPTPTRTVTPTP